MMTAGYAEAGLMSEAGEDVSGAYSTWVFLNTRPYRSATHGNRFVNNFANQTGAAEYGTFEDGGAMPEGAVLAKDSFVVTAKGQVTTGPLFAMEKMAAGFNEASGDWRYTLVMPDGTIAGTTNGAGSDQVGFCIDCHLAAERDSMFFMPDEFRQ